MKLIITILTLLLIVSSVYGFVATLKLVNRTPLRSLEALPPDFITGYITKDEVVALYNLLPITYHTGFTVMPLNSYKCNYEFKALVAPYHPYSMGDIIINHRLLRYAITSTKPENKTCLQTVKYIP